MAKQIFNISNRWKLIQPGPAFTVMASARRHLWYLVPQLVVISLCDPGLSAEERQRVAKALHATPKAVITSGRPLEEKVHFKSPRVTETSIGIRDPILSWLRVPDSAFPHWLDLRAG